MNFSQIREYTTGLIKKAFSNKQQLDKIGESPSGNLMFGDTEINAAGTIINNTYNGKLSYAENYSTEEQITGRWINGKPIYSKTIYVSESDLGSILQGRYYNIDISKGYPENIENLIDVKGFVNTTGNYPRSIFNLNISNLALSGIGYIWQPEDNRIVISLGDSQDITEATIVMSYTKTTDAENSFRPDMLEGATFSQDINYNNTLGYSTWLDTQEHVVGKWIDNRPLYQITLRTTYDEHPELFDSNNESVTIPLPDGMDGNIIRPVHYFGTYRGKHDDSKDTYFDYGIPSMDNVRLTVDRSYIRIANNIPQWKTGAVVQVTMQYYKSTDTPDTFDPAMLENVIVDRTYTGEITYESYYNIGERVIGRWIDGKPIYRRLRKYDTPLHASWQDKYTIAVDINSDLKCPNFLENADTPISAIVIGYTTWDSVRRKICAPVSARFEDDNWLYINFVANLSSDGFNIEYLCIDYTKTTDAENSFVPSLINNEEETIDIPAAIAADTIILNTYDSETEEQTEP